MTRKRILRKRIVLIGKLPADFLKINATPKQQQEAADQQAAIALHHQFVENSFVGSAVGRLNITVAQAKLVKNYGMTRMDPYVRLRVGHCVYETQTDPNGGKNPHWNKVIQCLLPSGVTTLYVEIYDECSFTMDELIAWAHITIPPPVLRGETSEDWYPLSGKQGDGKEGVINIVLSYVEGANRSCVYTSAAMAPPVMMIPSTAHNIFGVPQFSPVPVYTQMPQQQQQQQQQQLNQQSLTQIEEMFPNIDNEVIKSVFEANRGNKDATVNSLLQMLDV
ncbi:toll-interacting protein-like isoform X2 [Rhodnius prolixus]|uniref:toll-interacting protein-like isoform X2 n=1 Tax=Rhodnius prolixus TaxID=13249 RepID=UPI003D18ADEA